MTDQEKVTFSIMALIERALDARDQDLLSDSVRELGRRSKAVPSLVLPDSRCLVAANSTLPPTDLR